MRQAPVIAVVGPSGVGKDSVMEALEARTRGIQRLRRVITRPEGEVGEDFDRVSVEVFEQMVMDGAFSLHWSAHGLFYGVPSQISEQRKSCDAVMVNFSRSVLLQAQDVLGDLLVVSLTANAEVLGQRLAARGRESKVEQARRLGRARLPLPEGLRQVFEVDNSGALDDTVSEIITRLQLESA